MRAGDASRWCVPTDRPEYAGVTDAERKDAQPHPGTFRAERGDQEVSAWAAILFAPNLIDTVYGVNFDHMAELRWTSGYPLALLLMLLTCGGLYTSFKRHGWL